MTTLRANGHDFSVIERGTGVPVIFVHGANGDARTHEPVLDAVAVRYRCVSYSRRFHWPATEAPAPGTYAAQHHADDLAALLRALDAGPAHVVGHSYGGIVAALVARDHPRLVRSVVLGETVFAALVADDPASTALLALLGAALKPIAQLAGSDPRAASVALFDLVNGEPGAFEGLDPAQRAVWLDNAHTLAGTMTERRVAFSLDDLRGLAMPVLAVEGARSIPVYRMAVAAIARHAPEGSARATLACSGHMWMHDDPRGAADALLGFFSAH